MAKIKNPERRCRICGGKCERVVRYCKLCARERKSIRTLVTPGTLDDTAVDALAATVLRQKGVL